MRDLVLDTIRKYNLISRGDRVVIGVSGGHDSIALLYVMHSLIEELDFDIVVAHLNHGIRGIEADEDEEYVRCVSESLGVPFFSKRGNMDEYAAIHKLTSEEAGREMRYEFFKTVLETVEANKIAVAHNRNDQAETLLMRFMRGTGIDGLRGMEYESLNIIRPILNVSRRVIEDYCRELNLKPRVDKTNYMPIYGRNKVRLELIPFIEKTFNSNIINTLFRTSETMKTDSDFLDQYSYSAFLDLVLSLENEYIELDIEKLNCLHLAIRTRVIRHGISSVNKDLKGIEKKHIEDIIALISKDKTGKSVDIGRDIEVKTSYEKLVIQKVKKRLSSDFKYRVNTKEGEDLYIKELGSVLKTYVRPLDKLSMDFDNYFIKYLDYDKIKSEIYVRNRRNGDRFTPIGMSGSKKLKDFFIDQKIEREERSRIPLVLDGEEIIWVIGFRISDKYKISEKTKNVLVLEYELEEDKDEK